MKTHRFQVRTLEVQTGSELAQAEQNQEEAEPGFEPTGSLTLTS